MAVLVEGSSGVINYGEIAVVADLKVGQFVPEGILVGTVATVLRHDKGRPRSMLHVELYDRGTMNVSEWKVSEERPPTLRDPTPLLVAASLSTVAPRVDHDARDCSTSRTLRSQ